MAVIRKLGERVEKEHNQFLRDSQRIEDRSTPANGFTSPSFDSGVDFETLVGRSNANIKPDTVVDGSKSWDDDVWGSIFNSTPEVSKSLSFKPEPNSDDLTDTWTIGCNTRNNTNYQSTCTPTYSTPSDPIVTLVAATCDRYILFTTSAARGQTTTLLVVR